MRSVFQAVALSTLIISPALADTISYGELDAFRSLSMMVRFSDCTGDACDRHIPDTAISPEQFMQADTVDFAGYRLLTLPDWLFEMESLKNLRLSNSVLQWEDFSRLSQLARLEILDLDNVEVQGVMTNGQGNEESFAAVLEPMSNLAYLNLSHLKINDRHLDLRKAFLTPETASGLISLDVTSGQNFELISLPFLRLETLTAEPGSQFHSDYQDAFSLPNLVNLSGFSGVTAEYVRTRVLARRESRGLTFPGETSVDALGITVAKNTGALASSLGIPAVIGVVVLSLDPEGRAASNSDGHQFLRLDRIDGAHLSGRSTWIEISDVSDLESILMDAREDEEPGIHIKFYRGNDYRTTLTTFISWD